MAFLLYYIGISFRRADCVYETFANMIYIALMVFTHAAIDAPLSVPTGNVPVEATKHFSTPVVATVQDTLEDYVDCWRRKYPNVPTSWGDKLSADERRPAEKPAAKYDAMLIDEDTLQNRTDVHSPSLSSLHTRSRRHRRYSFADSDELMVIPSVRLYLISVLHIMIQHLIFL